MVSPSEIYIEQESATPIVDGELGDSDYVDFCVKCGCGVTSHEFSKEEITDG